MKLSFSFGEPVRFLISHPKYGDVVVTAYCGLEAKIEAANHWDVPYMEIKDSKVSVETAALRRLARCENEAD